MNRDIKINNRTAAVFCYINGVRVSENDFNISQATNPNRTEIFIDLNSNFIKNFDLYKNGESLQKDIPENQNINQILNNKFNPISKKDFESPNQELPANLVQFADQKIIELISIPSDEQSLTSFKTRYSILDDKWIECISIKKAYEDEKLILTSRKEGCTSCALGGLNRKYMKKLLPYLASEENMRFLYDAYLTLTFAEQLTDEQIEKSIQSKELQSVAKAIKKELVDRVNQKDENGNPVKACTSCEANRIKSKYIAMVKSVFDSVKSSWENS